MPRDDSYFIEKYNTLKLYHAAKTHIKGKFDAQLLWTLSEQKRFQPNTFIVIRPESASRLRDPQFSGCLRMFMARNCHSSTKWGCKQEDAELLVCSILSETTYIRIKNCENIKTYKHTRSRRNKTNLMNKLTSNVNFCQPQTSNRTFSGNLGNVQNEEKMIENNDLEVLNVMLAEKEIQTKSTS